MFTSSAVVFRTRQAVGDLREVVQFHRDAVTRLGRSGVERTAVEAVVSAGSLIPENETRVYTAILDAAARPDEDFNRFVAATAILLLDRLQDGGGTDDLYWNFDAFRDHYCLADPLVRAALMNGFRIAEVQGRVRLPKSPDPADCLTRHREDVLRTLEAESQDVLARTIRDEASPELAGRLWAKASRVEMTWTMRAGFRYLYERQSSLAPEDAGTVRLIPWP